MEDLTKFLEVGSKMGLTGKALLDFVEKRENAAREDLKQKEIRENEKEKEKIERDERNKEREIKKKTLELEYEKEQTLLKIQLADKEIELAKISAAAKKDKGVVSSDIKAKLPKLPAFCDGKDNMDAYLKRFERFAVNAKWPAEEWATNLSTLLQGKALDVYSRLSVDDANNYDALRDALLKRYQLTEEGFRQKFRNSKQEAGETAGQFVIRLNNYLTRWMELGKVPETFHGLKDLLLREQFLSVSQKSLVLFLKERKIKSIDEMIELAEQYMEAHAVSDNVYRSPNLNKVEKSETMKRPSISPLVQEGKGQIREYKERHCYGCGKSDHFIKMCPFKASRPNVSTKAAVLETEVETGDQRRESEETTSISGEISSKTVATCIVTPVTETGLSTFASLGVETYSKYINDVPLANISQQESSFVKDRYSNKMPVKEGYVGKAKVTVLRDSGCNSAIIRESLTQKEQLTGNTVVCTLADGTRKKFPVAIINVDTPYYKGTVEALCMPEPVYDLVLGNIDGVRSAENPDENWKEIPDLVGHIDHRANAVETRAQKVKQKRKNILTVPEAINEYSVENIIELQSEDTSLSYIKNQAQTGEVKILKDGSSIHYTSKDGLLYRVFKKAGNIEHKYNQLVVPTKLRTEVLKIAHDGIMSGHLGIRKTTDRILNEFFWPCIKKDVQKYCKTCDICQKTKPKGKVSQLPLGTMPIIDTPFSRIAIDIVGPIHPPSDKGNRFILTVVDYSTRYPEAKALKTIDTENVAEALLEIYSRVGIPREVLTDQGKQFTSDVMKEVGRLLSVKQLTTTPYHPACNGLVERFNGTLKSMLKKLSEEQPKQWDRYIPALLFAYREATQESTGFSPFELLYGRHVRGPLTILKQLWTKDIQDDEVRTTYQYVVDLRERLEETCQIVQEQLGKSSKRYKYYADMKKKDRQFQQGDEVLLLLPTDKNKLIMQWKGPFVITEKLNPFDYKVNINGKVKTYHGNMLMKYHRRQNVEESQSDVSKVSCVSVIETEGNDSDNLDYPRDRAEVKLQFPVLLAKETVEDVQVNSELDCSKLEEVQTLLSRFPDVFTDLPGTTDIVEHEIVVTTDKPIRSKPYPVPFSLKKEIKTEIYHMLEMGIIEPSNSPYASPVVLVKKPDGSYRFCCDFRKVNNVTVFDAEPIGNPEDLFVKMSGSKYFTKVDLSKGYWQIKMKENSKSLTAFVTPEGLFSFNKMPFGLVNSGATFCRMMRILLKGLKDTDNFVDDIIIHTETWVSHMIALEALLIRLRQAKLTARPSKCVVAVKNVSFLGHLIGEGMIQPLPEKVVSIRKCQRPCTKKQVRSFLGLIGYYRNFIPNFSAVSAPLSDLTKKGQPNKVRWQDEQENAFNALIQELSKSPILCLPNFERQFILRTDASDLGIGAVLLQENGEYKLPVAYASKKLLDRERRYSVIEKECFAIVWAVKKFMNYLYGKEFVLETDHRPLTYLNTAKVANARLMRWALALQPFKFRVENIKGVENVGADFLSRSV